MSPMLYLFQHFVTQDQSHLISVFKRSVLSVIRFRLTACFRLLEESVSYGWVPRTRRGMARREKWKELSVMEEWFIVHACSGTPLTVVTNGRSLGVGVLAALADWAVITRQIEGARSWAQPPSAMSDGCISHVRPSTPQPLRRPALNLTGVKGVRDAGHRHCRTLPRTRLITEDVLQPTGHLGFQLGTCASPRQPLASGLSSLLYVILDISWPDTIGLYL